MLDYEASGPTSRVYFSQRLRLHYVDWGNPGAPPLILLHGGRDHCRNWDWVASRLRHEWHIIAPDLRGHGDSQWSTDGYYNMPGYIYDLAQLVHQQQRSGIIISSVDGAPDIEAALKDPASPQIQASASQDPFFMARRAVQVGVGILDGQKPASTVELLPSKLVTRDNIAEYKGWTSDRSQ